MNYLDQEQVPSTWQIDDVILDKYAIRAIFTSGGMGLVYRAYHKDWDMDMAVKSPRPEFFQTEEQASHFEREAETWVATSRYQLLTGKFPYRFDPKRDPIDIILNENPVPIRDRMPRLAKEITTVIDKSLEKDPRSKKSIQKYFRNSRSPNLLKLKFLTHSFDELSH